MLRCALLLVLAASGALALRPGGVDTTYAKHELLVSDLGERASTNYFALTAYDAVWSLAHAIEATQDAGDSIHNSTALLHHMRGVEFEGASGDVRFDAELDRIGGYDLVQVGVDGRTRRAVAVGVVHRRVFEKLAVAHHAAAPAGHREGRMGLGPFRKFGLRAHHAGHGGDVGVEKAAFLALIWRSGQAGHKEKLNHDCLVELDVMPSQGRRESAKKG